MKPMAVLGVMLGAGIGGGLRYLLGNWIIARWGDSFPWHTMVINVSGAFLLGLLMALVADRQVVSPEWGLFLGVGLLGGFTTFSTLAYESIALMGSGAIGAGIGNLVASGVLGVLAAAGGVLAGRLL